MTRRRPAAAPTAAPETLATAAWPHFAVVAAGAALAGDPALTITLQRDEGPTDGPLAFAPLRGPRRALLQLSGALTPVQQGQLEVVLELRAGALTLPRGALPLVELQWAEGTRLTWRAAVERSTEGVLELRKAALHCEPPLRITPALGPGGLSQLRESAPWLGAIFAAIERRLPRAAQWLGARALQGLGQAVAIELHGFELSTEVRAGVPAGAPQLRGDLALRLFDRPGLRLRDVALPPALHRSWSPELARWVPLLADWARRVAGPAAAPRVAEAALRWVRRLDGWCGGRLQAPPIIVRERASDGLQSELRFSGSEALTVELGLAAVVEDDQLKLKVEPLRLRGQAQCTELRASGELELRPAPARAGHRSPRPRWRPRGSVLLEVVAPSALPPFVVEGLWRHPWCRGEARLTAGLVAQALHGRLRLELDGAGLSVAAVPGASFAATIAPGACLSLERGDLRLDQQFEGTLRLDHAPAEAATPGLQAQLEGRFSHQLQGKITPMPELELRDGTVRGAAEGTIELRLRARQQPVRAAEASVRAIDLSGTGCTLTLAAARCELDGRSLSAPAETKLALQLLAGGFDEGGLLPCDVDLEWDLAGRPLLLQAARPGEPPRALPLAASTHGRRALALRLDPSGHWALRSAAADLADVHYVNALLNPSGELQEWYRLLLTDARFAQVVAVLEALSPPLAARVLDLRLLALTARQILRREGLQQPADLLAPGALGRFLSLLLIGTTDLADELRPILEAAAQGRGVPLALAKPLLMRELGEFGLDFEIGALLGWVDYLLRAGEPLGAGAPEPELPLAAQPTHAAALAGLPAAAEIYRRAHAHPPNRAQLAELAQLAPDLSLEQLEYLLEQADDARWGADTVRRLRFVAQLKRRVRQLGASGSGIQHSVQPLVLAPLLATAVGRLPGLGASAAGPRRLGAGGRALGAEEIALLLHAGLATPRQGQRMQLNNRLLLELLRQAEPELLRAVLVELGQQSPRVLSGTLYAFLEQDQDQLVTPFDIAALLRDKLKLEVPRQKDFLAGGPRARESYYEQLSLLAERVLAGGDGYLARKQHLQRVRHPVPGPLALSPAGVPLAREAQQALAGADAQGQAWLVAGASSDGRLGVCQGYERAAAACAALLVEERRAFELPWLARFWGRNEEALRVLSVLRELRREEPGVARWLHARTGGQVLADEQARVTAVVRALYARAADQRQLLADPLLRALWEPEAGHYALTIVSCMGVVTGGAEGEELAGVFAQLEAERGVRVVRAATGTGRSLEHNAERIIEAIAACDGPFALLGYSQGAANALLAEHLLFSGTPAEQRQLDRLVARGLLFSAANGSAHGSAAMAKLTRAMVLGERLLKPYQATHSWPAIRAVLRGLRALLDTPALVATLSGTHSLSLERARVLHRDGQWLAEAPTSHTRASTRAAWLPDALVYTHHVLNELSGGADQDSQVLTADAVGSATRVRNEATVAFARSERESPPQATHHWAPVGRQVAYLTTDSDRLRAVYDHPVEQLVWPWVETLARFGLVRRRAPAEKWGR
ncbi:MAG: hypothetical protein IPG96_13805 [Proteobacteria bacterium]|nr:hypothetical protein [Pseudomonadota bacterium]